MKKSSILTSFILLVLCFAGVAFFTYKSGIHGFDLQAYWKPYLFLGGAFLGIVCLFLGILIPPFRGLAGISFIAMIVGEFFYMKELTGFFQDLFSNVGYAKILGYVYFVVIILCQASAVLVCLRILNGKFLQILLTILLIALTAYLGYQFIKVHGDMFMTEIKANYQTYCLFLSSFGFICLGLSRKKQN